VSTDLPLQVKHSRAGAAAIKPTEVALEQITGRKKSRFWYYAVEPASPAVVRVAILPRVNQLPCRRACISPAPNMDDFIYSPHLHTFFFNTRRHSFTLLYVIAGALLGCVRALEQEGPGKPAVTAVQAATKCHHPTGPH
jgi:hypothetical protein